ncbi:hypothetical protein DL93DRAFT_2091097 [Clavulina sp. PMI_390]|nr:hypothetical protein DL93DRAFT_2091097 [Clavulina sp. PMI_390]
MAGGRISSVVQSSVRLLQNTGTESLRRYTKLGWKGKAFVWFLILLHIGIASVFIFIGPAKIFQTLYDTAQKLKAMPLGWLILISMAIILSFPPLIGYSTTMTLCGFAYGPLGGLLVAGTGALIGSTLTFIILRLLYKERVKKWTSQNKRWQAMEAVIEAKGLPLIVMIRLCPIPWVYSNALFASMESVQLWQFVFATICLMPKLFLVIFVGSQVAKLSDGKTRGEMSPVVKVLNVLSIVLTAGVAFGTGWFVWKQTENRIRHMQGEGLSPEIDREAADGLDEATRPLLHHVLSSDDLLGEGEQEPLFGQPTGKGKSQETDSLV